MIRPQESHNSVQRVRHGVINRVYDQIVLRITDDFDPVFLPIQGCIQTALYSQWFDPAAWTIHRALALR